ncbi:MAG: hypothetical protein DYH13_00055 [Alphaproteobacteria bacterium PRO2]|nr:hypothetical protein [Alphaproteobacteria bacterium PRO2]
MGDTKQNDSRLNKPLFLGMTALGLVLMFKPGHDGDIGFGMNSGPSPQGQNKAVVLKPHNIKLATLPAFVPAVERTEPGTARITPSFAEPEVTNAPVAEAATTPPQHSPAIPHPGHQAVAKISSENQMMTPASAAPLAPKAAAAFASTAQREENPAKALATPNMNDSAMAASAASRDPNAKTVKIYAHKYVMDGYCTLKEGTHKNCMAKSMEPGKEESYYVPAHDVIVSFILAEGVSINIDDAKAKIEAAGNVTSRAMQSDKKGKALQDVRIVLEKEGIIILREKRINHETGQRTMFTALENGATTTWWFNRDTGALAEKMVVFKDQSYTYEGYDSAKNLWAPLTPNPVLAAEIRTNPLSNDMH